MILKKLQNLNIKEKYLTSGGNQQCKCFNDLGKKETEFSMLNEFICKNFCCLELLHSLHIITWKFGDNIRKSCI